MAQLAPQPPRWVDEAPLQIVESRSIRAAPAAVWDVLADNEGWVNWFPGFKESAFTTAAPHGVGSIRYVHQDQFKVQEKITQWNPGKAWGMTVVAINVPVLKAMAENVQLVDEGTMTNVRWHIGAQPAGWARPLRPLLAAKARRGLKQALEQLDAIVGER